MFYSLNIFANSLLVAPRCQKTVFVCFEQIIVSRHFTGIYCCAPHVCMGLACFINVSTVNDTTHKVPVMTSTHVQMFFFPSQMSDVLLLDSIMNSLPPLLSFFFFLTVHPFLAVFLLCSLPFSCLSFCLPISFFLIYFMSLSPDICLIV